MDKERKKGIDHAWIQNALEAAATEKHRRFMAGLLPGVTDLLGVPMSPLRALAKGLVRDVGEAYLDQPLSGSVEANLLEGLVIGLLPLEEEVFLRRVAAFVPKISNWAVCDSFCSALKKTRCYEGAVWTFLQPYLDSKETFPQRFGLVMLNSHYLTPTWQEQVLEALGRVEPQGYYGEMALAWVLSSSYLKAPELTLPLLQPGKYEEKLRQKALQKILDSLKLSQETRREIKVLKAQKKEGVS